MLFLHGVMKSGQAIAILVINVSAVFYQLRK
jgi:hypothetical protein